MRSEFDVRHVINPNGVWQLPFGKGRKFFSGADSFADALLGVWQLAGLYRWTRAHRATIWLIWAAGLNVRSSAVRTRPIQTSPTRGGNGHRRIFSPISASFSPRSGLRGRARRGQKRIFEVRISRCWI